MNQRITADKLRGSWSGRYSLWLGPDMPVRESTTKASISSAARGQFLVISYTWTESDKQHDGVLMVRLADDPSSVDMVWVDSFHTMGGFMQFEGTRTSDGSVEGTTKWSVGDGPDWGWRIVVSAPGPDEFVVNMFIATPTGEESPAVESRYTPEPTPPG